MPPANFLYLNDHNGGVYKPAVRRLLRLEPQFPQPWAELPRESVNRMIETAEHNWGSKESLIPIMKDPIAVFSTEWLATNFRVQPVILLRHPVSIAKSLLRLGWTPKRTLNFLRSQPDLGSEYLGEEHTGRLNVEADEAQTDLDKVCLFVRAIVLIIAEYERRYPEWNYLSYESLTESPQDMFLDLFARLGLEPSEATFNTLSTEGEYDPSAAHQKVVSPIMVDRTAIWDADDFASDWRAVYQRHFSMLIESLDGIVDWESFGP